LLCEWLDHPRRAFGGLYHCAKFGWNRCSSFDNMHVLVFCDFGLKTPIHAPFGGFWGHSSPKNVTHRPNHKKDRPWVEPRHLSHKAWISAAWFELGIGTRKQKGQDRKKVTKGLYFTYLGKAPTQAICVKNSVIGDLLDVITCAKFQNEIFRGYNFTGGRTFRFPIDFWMGLTTEQRYCAACDVNFGRHQFLKMICNSFSQNWCKSRF